MPTQTIPITHATPLIFSHPLVDRGKPFIISTGASMIQWPYQLNMNITPTLGGQVGQVLSCYVDQMTISGQTTDNVQLYNIYNWFLHYMNIAGLLQRNEQAITFSYPERGWQFAIQVVTAPNFQYNRDLIATEWTINAEVVQDEGTNVLSSTTMNGFTSAAFDPKMWNVGFNASSEELDPLNPFNRDGVTPQQIGDNMQSLIGAWSTGDYSTFGFNPTTTLGGNALNTAQSYWEQAYGTDYISGGPKGSGSGAAALNASGTALGPTYTCSILNSDQNAFANLLSQRSNLSFLVCAAWVQAESAGESGPTIGYNFLNAGEDTSNGKIGTEPKGNFPAYASVQYSVANTMLVLNQSNMKSILAIAANGGTTEQQLNAIGASPWDGGHYGGAPGYPRLYGALSVVQGHISIVSSPGSGLGTSALTIASTQLGNGPSQYTNWYQNGSTGAAWCFPPGTLIQMATGGAKKIEDILPLEEVTSAEGNVQTVLKTLSRSYVGKLIQLDIWGHNALTMTPNHEVLTERGYVPAKDLLSTDFIAIPKILPRMGYLEKIEFSDYADRRRKTNKGVKIGTGTTSGKNFKYMIDPLAPKTIPLSEKFGRLLGLYLAEGSVKESATIWDFSVDERFTLVEECMNLIREIAGKEPSLSDRTNIDHTFRISLHNKVWAGLFRSLSGTGSAHKRLHSDLFMAPKQFLSAVFHGWLSGDGYRQHRVRKGSTVSPTLAYDMYRISLMLGLRPSLRWYHPAMNNYAKTRKIKWEVSIPDPDNPGNPAPGVPVRGEDTWRCKETELYTWRKVRKLVSVPYAGIVYNLEVEKDNSYIAQGIGVHNCAIFVSYCLNKAGSNYFVPGFSESCAQILSAAQNKQKGLQVISTPGPGDMAIYNWASPPTEDGHINFFMNWNSGSNNAFTAVGGNQSGGIVSKETFYVNNPAIGKVAAFVRATA